MGPIIGRKLIQMGLDFTGKQVAEQKVEKSPSEESKEEAKEEVKQEVPRISTPSKDIMNDIKPHTIVSPIM